MKKIIVFVCSSQPDPTTIRKMDALAECGQFLVFLNYWHREKSLISKPFTTKISNSNINRICLREPRGRLAKRALLNLIYLIKTFHYFSKIKPDIIHASNLDMLILCAGITSRFKNTKLVLDLLDTRKFFLKGIWRKLAVKAIRKSNLVLISSEKYYDSYLKHLIPLLDKRDVIYIPNAPKIGELSQPSNIYIKKLTIGYIGTFRGREAINGLVETVLKLRSKNYNYTILFAGVGIDQPLVKELADNYDFIDYHGAFDYMKDASDLYAKVQFIFSVYSLDDNKKIHLSCRYNDAIVIGKPIIVLDGTYQSELVSIHNIGFSIQFTEWEKLESELIKFYDNREHFLDIRRSCEKIKINHFFDFYKLKLIKAYSEIS